MTLFSKVEFMGIVWFSVGFLSFGLGKGELHEERFGKRGSDVSVATYDYVVKIDY